MHLHHALALHHARVAGVALLEDRLHHRGAVDLAGLVERALGVVAGGMAAQLVLDAEHPGGAVLAEPLDAGVDLLHLLEALGQLAELLGHRRLGRLGAAHDDGLQALGAHHRAHAGAAVRAVRHVHDRGEAHQVLAGWPDLRYFGLRIADCLLQEPIDLAGHLAPQVLRRAQLGLAVGEPEIDRLGRAAGEHDRVGAGAAHLGREEPTALAVADRAGER